MDTAWRRPITVGLLFAGVLALRLIRLDQPILENFVGRQVPTAMVARDVSRGGSLLRPQLQTGPFPNYFLVEPPIYAGFAALVHRFTPLPLEPAGRLVSAVGMTLAAIALFGLVNRRLGRPAAVLAVVFLGTFPVSLRYGRAFQPDTLALGLVLLGLERLDPRARKVRIGSRSVGWTCLSLGLATRVLLAFALVPWLLEVWRDRSIPSGRRRLWLMGAGLALVPAFLWYVHASSLLGEGSAATKDNARIWLRVLVPTDLLEPGKLASILRMLTWRTFTPIAVGLAAIGVIRGRPTAFGLTWGVTSMGVLLWLAGKAHHDYYALMLTPALAVLAAAGLQAIGKTPNRRWLAPAIGMTYLGLSFALSASTWSTPPDWRAVGIARVAIARCVPADRLLMAPEALLFEADRRGCRLETEAASAVRAAGEWGVEVQSGQDAALRLIEAYRDRGACYFADVGDPSKGRLHQPLHEALRRRYHPVLADEPGFLLIRLDERAPACPPTSSP